MTKDRIIEILHHPTKITASDLVGLEAITKKYPYFHAAHILSAYGSYLLEIPNYEAFLQKGILYATREDYFNEYISHRPAIEEEEEAVQETSIQEKAVEEKEEVQEKTAPVKKPKAVPTRPKKKLLVDNPDYERKEANLGLFQEVERSIRSLQSSKEKALDYLDTHKAVVPKKEIIATTEQQTIEDQPLAEHKETTKEELEQSTPTAQELPLVVEEVVSQPETLQTDKQEEAEQPIENVQTALSQNDVLSEENVQPTDSVAELAEEQKEQEEEANEEIEPLKEKTIAELYEEQKISSTTKDTTLSSKESEPVIKEKQEEEKAPIEEEKPSPKGEQEEDKPSDSIPRARRSRRRPQVEEDEDDIEALIDKKAAFLKSIKARIEAKKSVQANEDNNEEKKTEDVTENKIKLDQKPILQQEETNVSINSEDTLYDDAIEEKAVSELEEPTEDKATVVETEIIEIAEQQDLPTNTPEPHVHTKEEESTSNVVETEDNKTSDPDIIKEEEQVTQAIGFSLGNTTNDELDKSSPVLDNHQDEHDVTEATTPKEEEPIATSVEVEEQKIEEEVPSAGITIVAPEPPLEIEDYPLENIKQLHTDQEKDKDQQEEKNAPSPTDEQKESMDRDLMLSYIDSLKKKKVDAKDKKSKEKSQKPVQVKETKSQFDIIDDFIKKEKDLTPIRAKEDNTEIKDLSKHSVIEKGALVSENLATINIKQGKIQKAIKIYEALMLKNPAKKAYFASQIQKIKENI